MIDILIRTSNRPGYFKDCVESVEQQTFKDWRILVSVDDTRTEKYVKPYGYEYVKVDRGQRNNDCKCPWNQYFNALLRRTKDWVVYLDDDVILSRPDSLQIIADHCKNKDRLLIWKYQFANGRVIPESNFWGNYPQRQHIDTGCFAHHSKHRVVWVTFRASDWRVCRELYKKLDTIWIDKILFRAQNNGTNGTRQDKR